MKPDEIVQQLKNEALNTIREMYHPNHKGQYDNFNESGSYAEQRENRIRDILQKLEKEIAKVKIQKKQPI